MPKDTTNNSAEDLEQQEPETTKSDSGSDSDTSEAQDLARRTETNPELRYQTISTLGEGGMAIVSDVLDTRLNRRIAIKRLRGGADALRRRKLRFRAEYEAMANLEHPGVIPVYDAGMFPDGADFYAMKKVKGQTLREVIDQQVRRPNAQRIAYYMHLFERICETMAFAHSKKIIHRDLKPLNIMLDDFGQLFVLDWGLAKELGKEQSSFDEAMATSDGDILGSPSYMSPEQAMGKSHQTEYSADVFALGCILYEMLTGRRAFDGNYNQEILNQIINLNPVPPKRANTAVSRKLSEICLKALNKNPAKRYHNAQQLLDDIRHYREFRPVSAAPPRLLERISDWGKRNKTLSTAVSTLVIALLMLFGGYTVYRYQEILALNETMEKVGLLEQEIAAVAQKIETMRSELRSINENPALTRRKELALEELVGTRRLMQRDILAQLAAAVGFSGYRPNQQVQENGRQAIIHSIETALDDGDNIWAKILATAADQRYQKDNFLNFSKEDFATIAKYRDQAASNILDQAAGVDSATR